MKQGPNGVTQVRGPLLMWIAGFLAAALLLVSTLELADLPLSLATRFVLLFLGLIPGCYFLYRVFRNSRLGLANGRRFLMVIFAVHVIATLYFFPLTDIVNDRPVITLDHSFHYYQAVRTREVFWETFRFDRYDPYFMAGYPGGTIFDLDMKGAELFCAFVPLASVARTLKLFILCAYLTMVMTIYWGSRLQGFKIEESLVGLLVFLLWWHWGRPYAGDFRYAGMFSFVFASHLCFLLVGLLRRFARGALTRMFFGLGPLVFLIHPTSAIMLPVPFSVAIGADRKLWTFRKWVLLVFWCLVVIFINSMWLKPFFEYLWMKTTTELYYQIDGLAGLTGLLVKPTCLIAIAMIVLSVAGVIRAGRDKRLTTVLPAAAGALFLFVVASAGTRTPGIKHLEPGRFLFPAFVFLAPLSGVGLRWLVAFPVSRIRSTVIRESLKAAGFVALVVAMLPLSLLESKSFYRHTLKTTYPAKVASLVEAVTSRVSPPGRLMIEDCEAVHYGDIHLPALLPLATGVEQIGGPYPHTYLLHYFSAFRWEQTFGRPMSQWDSGALGQYLDLYGIRWIVTATASSTTVMRNLLGKSPDWTLPPYALWDTGWISPDSKLVVSASMNHIDVSGSGDSTGYFIRYHWIPGLKVSGAANIRPVHRLDDPIPFIFIEPNGENDLEIVF